MNYDRSFFQAVAAGSTASAHAVIPLVLEYVRPRSVVDVGCGTGTWLRAFQEHGVTDVMGFDGPWVNRDLLVIPPRQFTIVDLTQPIVPDRRFDLAVCLETAEHLPAAAARGLVASLTSLAPVILFSAAIPFQGGQHHLNEEWPEYWARLFAEHRVRFADCLRARVWTNPCVDWWYAQNMFLAVDSDYLSSVPRLADAVSVTEAGNLARVHPRAYLESTTRAKSVSELFQAALGAVRRRRFTRRTAPYPQLGSGTAVK